MPRSMCSMIEPAAKVVAVARDEGHNFSKPLCKAILLIAGRGVEGDAHCGTRVKHRSRVAVDPSQPNLRQVHLIAVELIEELRKAGFALGPGQLGENITTRDLDLIALSRGTRLRFGGGAEIELTGLRNPCAQIEDFGKGLLARVVRRTVSGEIERRAGVMAVVIKGGKVTPGDPIELCLPTGLHRRLERV